MTRGSGRVRDKAVVYLEARDRELLERLARETGLARTELFRRGLRRRADELLERAAPARRSTTSSIRPARATPPDVAERHDAYLYGGSYARHRNARRWWRGWRGSG